MLSHITVEWLSFFSKSKHFYRFLQAYNMFGLCVNSADASVLIRKNLNALVSGGVNSYACTNTILKTLTQNRGYGEVRSSKHFLFSRTGFAGNSGLMTLKPEDHGVLAPLGPNTAVFDRLGYPYDLSALTSRDSEADLLGLEAVIHTSSVSHVVTIRQILIYITLFNLRS